MQDGNGSLTAAYLRNERAIQTPRARRPATRGQIVIKGARENNLKDIDDQHSARRADDGHGRQRFGQVDARQ